MKTLFTVLWLVLLSACAVSGPRAMGPMEEYLGFANWECDVVHPYAFVRVYNGNSPLVWITQDSTIKVTAEFVGIVAHELKHVEQMKRFNKCEDWHKAWADSSFRSAMEREAYRAGDAFQKRAERF